LSRGQSASPFVTGEAFPESDPVAVWIASLSRALNDIRTASNHAVRPKQPAHERLYFVRVLATHIREAVKLVAREHDDPPEVQRFIAGMPQVRGDALDEIKRRIDTKFKQRSTISLFDDIKRLRDDTFHYGSVRDADSIERMRAAMREVADEEGVYRSPTRITGPSMRTTPPLHSRTPSRPIVKE
jgi:hypothetical protein